MPSLRIILIVAIVLAILCYLFVLVKGSRLDGFADLGEKDNVFTMYYMNGCPHCEAILPDFKNFVAEGQVVQPGKKTSIRMVEQGDPDTAKEIETRNIKGYPTFILATKDGKYIEHQGERTISAMRKFITSNAV